MKQPHSELTNHFIRGAVAGGLLSALQAQPSGQGKKAKKILKHAVQGGFAVSAGLGVANSIERGDYGSAIVLLLTGAAGVAGAELMIKE